MNYNNLFLFLSLVCTSYLIEHVLTLNAEHIMNGQIANIQNFPYMAMIIAREHNDATNKLLCSGVIVSTSWILSVAQCFMLTSEIIKQIIFTAVVGTSKLGGYEHPTGYFEKIDHIYTMDYDAYNYANDITMAKTLNDLVLSDAVKIIGVANSGHSFLGLSGLVSGYGAYQMVRVGPDNALIKADTDSQLRNTTVTAKKISRCSRSFPFIKRSDKFCGIAEYIENRYTGACSDDIGSPLVIDNVVVGLSSITYFDCSDINSGSLYIDVQKYFSFIETLRRGNNGNSYRFHAVNPNPR